MTKKRILKHMKDSDGNLIVDFVNKNNISREDIQQITGDKYDDHLYYWDDVLEVENE